MNELKIANFRTAHPNTNFPVVRNLPSTECGSLKAALATKLDLPPSSSGLDVLRALESAGKAIAGVHPSEDGFSPASLLRERQSGATSIYINWNRFNDVDEMDSTDFDSFFHDLWYPSSDDIEIFDRSLSWVLLIRHFDVIQSVKL